MKWEIPWRAIYVLLGAFAIAFLLYILGIPGGIIALVGIGIWAVLLIAQGGHLEGNPYKRMRYSSVPDFTEVWQYQKRQQEEVQDHGKTRDTVFMLLLGLVFLAVGIFAFFFPWTLWSVF